MNKQEKDLASLKREMSKGSELYKREYLQIPIIQPPAICPECGGECKARKYHYTIDEGRALGMQEGDVIYCECGWKAYDYEDLKIDLALELGRKEGKDI